ncbi:MAG: hypothetical protein H6826_13870 [Planctomycetes bacterium]|nr:hypothetical protein [Planctomycetota bacterium]MCB9902426.1 hypothetical protein [Planctomycetota bacterium]
MRRRGARHQELVNAVRRSRQGQRTPRVHTPAGAGRRAALYRELGPVSLPLRLGALGRKPTSYVFIAFIGLFLAVRAGELATRPETRSLLDYVTFSIVAFGLLMSVLSLRSPLIQITEEGIDLQERPRGEVRHIPRDKVGCLLDHGPNRMFLRVIGERNLVRLPTKALSSRERFLLARCLTHYDVGNVFG